MQVVRHGGVDDVDVSEGEQFAVAGDEVPHARHLAEPVEQARLQVADRGELGADGKIHEREPAGARAGGLAAHQAAADDADADGLGGHR